VARAGDAAAAVVGAQVSQPSLPLLLRPVPPLLPPPPPPLVAVLNARVQRARRGRLQLHRRSSVQAPEAAAVALHNSHDGVQQGAHPPPRTRVCQLTTHSPMLLRAIEAI
jgi:hypothetical protein